MLVLPAGRARQGVSGFVRHAAAEMSLHSRSKDRPFRPGAFPLESLPRDSSVIDREVARPKAVTARVTVSGDNVLARARAIPAIMCEVVVPVHAIGA
jgi:hypothetical protein